ncbi:MAG: bifunctional glycosyltransferase/class I SAM-dependent methyltransferase [Cyanobacteriota bacterium]|nr:bifunctional glycosyltransferase/class I SAM-dependent methyltransferase [Cyanobacteriota bacterium]
MISPSSQQQTVAIVQARMNSTRLPGKVLLPLADRQVLFHIWERLSRVQGLDAIVIATTAADSDRPIVEFCRSHQIEVFAYEGSADNLLDRYIGCGDRYHADIIVMVDGDCPLLHPPTIERMAGALRDNSHAEYCQLEESSIEGGVAVLRLATYKKMAQLATEPCHREHATLFLVENPHLFSIVKVPCEDEFRDIKHRLWLDTPADYRFLNQVYDRLYQPGEIVDLRAVVRWLKTDAELRSINARVTQKDVRERVRPLAILPYSLPEVFYQQAWEVVSVLTERFHVGVRLLAADLSPSERDWWHRHNLTLWDRSPQPGEAVLSFDAEAEGFQPLSPSGEGMPRMQIGLSGGESATALATLAACYGGYQSTASGYLEATQQSSADGSHLETPPCPLCGSENRQEIWSHPTGVTNGICLDCGHIYLTRQLSDAAIDISYRDYQQSYPDDYLRDPSNGFFELAGNRHQLLQKYLPQPPKTLLEIGCGYGHFLSLCGSECDAFGIEPSHEQALFARKYFENNVEDLEIWECHYNRLDLKPSSWPKNGFDVICGFHVLEHIKQPDRFLKFARKLLKPGGYLTIAVPNIFTLSPDLIELFFIYRNWHLHTFSPDTLSRILRQAGFEIVELSDEQPIPMLRSSTIAIARSVETPVSPPILPDRIAESRTAIERFHSTLDTRLQKVKEAFQKWTSDGTIVAIYGGGIHTQALLELSGIQASQIRLIIDDNPQKQGQTLQGIPIYNFQTALTLGIEAIVVSSLASEHKILPRLEKTAPPQIQIVGIYRDLIKTNDRF